MLIKLIIIVQLLATFTEAGNGPVGYQLYRESASRLSELRPGVHTKQFSSFDRRGLNDDGGPFACLKLLVATNAGHCIIAEHLGAGEVDSIWMTRDNGVFNKTGKIVVELDGIRVIDNHLQDVLNGQLGPPFVWPLVGNGDDTSGGGVIKVPMTYRRSMKITVDTNPNYYHVTYRTFADSLGVQTFDPLDTADDIIDQLRAFGTRSPDSNRRTAGGGGGDDNPILVAHKVVDFRTTDTPIIDLDGISGEIREIRLQVPELVRSPRTVDDGRAFGGQNGGSSEFYARIDPKNSGVRLTRRLDPSVAAQVAQIYIDGQPAGYWNSTAITGITENMWSEETVAIDPKLTKNKTHLNIRQVFQSSKLDFNEFRYEIDSLVAIAAADGQQYEWLRTDVLEIGPNHPGDESGHRYHIDGQTWSGSRVFRYAGVDYRKRLADSTEFLALCRLVGQFDGHLTIDTPVGQFFGSGLGMYDTRSLWFSVDARTGTFRSWWPMPFATRARISVQVPAAAAAAALANDIYRQFPMTADVYYVKDPSIKQKFAKNQLGHFYATYRNETTRPGIDYIFLNTTGRGQVYGVSHTMHGLIETGNLRDYMEGDERIYLDGKHTPELYGTGTEDFYESGWFFRNGITFDMPLNGNSGYETKGCDDCLNDCTQALRLYTGGLSFESGLVMGIEHGPIDDNEPAVYQSVAYWYGRPDQPPALKLTDSVDPTDQDSRQRHRYVASGIETRYELNSAYEGQSYKQLMKTMAVNTDKPVEFTVDIDSMNNGVRLFRTADQLIGYQCSDVYIDGQLVGRWLQPLGNQWSRLLDDSYDLSPVVTRNKSRLTVRLVPVGHESGPVVQWSAIRYNIMSIVN
ncbi:uncharacterized protein LOC128953225 [Oppia nitens]|uniref:uncharacterized protein LOC128953225 n=1 Tax=Oppia nitens TaxID=1686743 RepID=UPI0023DAFB8D|nr:uncharacterized protein LOC128953225 [Oppia nitens]